MKAKDTVMKVSPSLEGTTTDLLEEQAEISFKAGIKEVVEWIRQQPKMGTGVFIVGIEAEQLYSWKVLIGALQDKKKEWGLSL